MTIRYPQLLTPFELKGKTFRNRFVMSPMTRGQSPGNVPGPDVAAYYGRRAGEVGMIVTEGVGIDHPSALGNGVVDEGEIPIMAEGAPLDGWRGVVDTVHEGGALIMPQLWHMGPMRRPGTGPNPDAPSMRPSGIWGPPGRAMVPPDYLEAVSEPSAPMSDSDIADVIAAFGKAAAVARKAGFDGVALHGAHGYLIDGFLWDETNLRDDQWGGDAQRRSAFAEAVVREVREAAGPNLIVSFRYSQWKQQDYGASIAPDPDALGALLTRLGDAGVDLFDVSTRYFHHPAFEGSDLSLAAWTKKLSGKAVSAVGGVGMSKDLATSFVEETVTRNNLDLVAEAFDRGDFDLIALGRGLLMDPKFVTKALADEPLPPFRREAYATLD